MLLLRVIRTELPLQVPQREIVEREAALTRPDQVGGQGGVGGDAGELPATAFEVVHGQLGLVQCLRLARVGQPRCERGLIVGVQGRGVEVAAVAVGRDDRQCGGVGVVRQMRTDNGHPEPLAGSVFGQPGRQFAGLERAASDVETLVHLGVCGGQRVEQPVAQNPELEVVEEAMDLVAVPGLHPQRVRRLGQRHVLDQLGELAVEDDTGQVRPQRVTDLALHRVHLVDQCLQRPVFGDPLGGRLLPHARDAGQVVARVAAQGCEVGILPRGEPVLLQHGLRGEPGQLTDALTGVEHRDVVTDQLQRVAVTRHHQNPVPLILGLRRERRDDVVSLEPGLRQHRDAQCAEDLFGDVDLAAELVGRRRPALLVLRVFLLAEGLAGHVERGRDVGRLLVAQQVDQHRGESVDRIGGQATLGLEILGGQRVERPERQRIAVQQHQCRLFGSPSQSLRSRSRPYSMHGR